MTEKKYVLSNATIIQRIPKSETNPYGYIPTEVVPFDKPTMAVFGGDLTQTERNANYYAKQIEELLKESGISNINIYSIAYNFGSGRSKLERAEMFRSAGRRIKEERILPEAKKRLDLIQKSMKDNEPVPNYIKQLYKIFLYPRISDENNKPLNINDAVFRIRKIKFYAHCQGAAALGQMSNYMYDEMLRMGYEKKNIEKIQKELLVIQHSPLAPLNKQKFMTISFASANDTMMQDHNNQFADWFNDNYQDIIPCYFGPKHGNIFIATNLYTNSFKEHDNRCIVPSEEISCPLTTEGKIIFTAERNALIRSALKAIDGTPIKSVAELTDGNGVNFKRLKKNGDAVYSVMLNDLHLQNLSHDHQK